MNYEEIVNNLPVSVLTNTKEDTFWYTTSEFSKRFNHEKAKVDDTFYDGNNGDKWKVIAANTKHNRLVVENLTQGGIRLVIWDVL